MVDGIVPIHIGQTAVVGIATVKTVAAVLKNYLLPPNITED